MNKQQLNISQASGSEVTEKIRSGLYKRYRSERRFQMFGFGSIVLGLLALIFLFFSIVSKGYSAFQQTYVQLSIVLEESVLDPEGTNNKETLRNVDYGSIVKASMRGEFPEVTKRRDKRALYSLLSPSSAYHLRDTVLSDPGLIGSEIELWFPADDDIDMLNKGHIDRSVPESQRRVTDQKIAWIDKLTSEGRVKKRFNWIFFNSGDSREPELAGIGGALIGSLLTLIVTLLLSFPVGMATAIYLEEFAPKNRWTDLIEININNLAAVPSIVFGLLGLAVFLNFFHLPRSAPIVGGLVLTLMTLPVVIIAGRAALQSVPPSIREAALSMGASRVQATFDHILPLAVPGMLTGTIIGMSRALGETAPLLMIGMVAFIVDIPGSFTDPSTALPVQIYLWLDSPERAFVEKSSAAIMVLLLFLITMNSLAVFLRSKFEQRW